MSLFGDTANSANRVGPALAPQFLELAACPACHSKLALDYEAGALVCTRPDCGLSYPVVDGVPILLIDKAGRPGGNLYGDEGDVPGDIFS